MADTMRAVRAAVKRVHVRCGGFPMPTKRYAPCSWYRVQPRGYYADPYRWRKGKRRGQPR